MKTVSAINSSVSLGSKLVQSVQKEAAMQRPLPLTATAHEHRPGHARIGAKVVLTDNDRLSHMVEKVSVSVSSSKSKTQSPKSVAERFAARATYLTESLGFVESDAGGAAVLRSTPTTMRSRRAEYFEARVTDAEISLQRFQPRADKPGRDTVPFCLTDEVLSRLTDDAANALL